VKDFDNIEDWYKEELNNFNVNPDEGVWNSLSDELDADMTLTDENISEWYKREVAKLEERPDFTVWEKLATKLDTTSVWDKLVVSLNRYDQLIWWRNTILKGTAILLLLSSSYLAYNKYSNNKNTSLSGVKKPTGFTKSAIAAEENSNTKINFPSSNSSHSSSLKNEETKMDNSSSIASALYNENNKSVEETISAAKKNLRRKSSANNQSQFGANILASTSKEIKYNSKGVTNWDDLKSKQEQSIFEEIERRKITTDDISHVFSSADFLVKKEKNKIVFNSKRFSQYTTFGLYARRFYFGMNAGIKKQGLITAIKKDGLLANHGQSEFLDFGGNTGLIAGYILSDKINLEANANIISSSGYKRGFTAEGNSFKETLNLNYTSISLLAKKMNTKSTFDNKVYSTNIIAGVYAGILNSSSSVVNGVKLDNDNFSNTDFGIVLGLEQDRYLSKTLVLTPGVRYNQGLANIASDSSPYNSARNFSLEFNVGLKYIFLKTSK
jgi:hypothetical protein